MMNYTLFTIGFVYWVILLIQRQSLQAMLNFDSTNGIINYGGGVNHDHQLSKRVDYIDVYGVGVLGEWLNVITATNAILSSWKLFAYFRASKKLSLLVSTLIRAAGTMTYFLIIIAVFILAYALAFYTAFHNATPHFKSFTLATRTLGLALLSGDTSAWDNDIYIANRYFGPLVLFVFLFVCSTLVLAMVVAIIDDAFMETQHEIGQGYQGKYNRHKRRSEQNVSCNYR